MVQLKVIKKNGKKVNYDPKRIVEACISAGAEKKIAREVAEKVTNKFINIPTDEVRRLTIQELKKLDSEAADSWIKYDLEHAD
ncbi:MAG: hypothetical protein GF353_08820 [Candidatus Lokiarchaeota archaeon]|nr:hypothetical protein [Candidatus Lokiarchaeota archaeon]